MECILTFQTTSASMEAEKRLKEAGIENSAMSVPSSLKAGCGICLCLKQAFLAAAEKVLADAGVSIGAVYLKETIDSKFVFTPLVR